SIQTDPTMQFTAIEAAKQSSTKPTFDVEPAQPQSPNNMNRSAGSQSIRSEDTENQVFYDAISDEVLQSPGPQSGTNTAVASPPAARSSKELQPASRPSTEAAKSSFFGRIVNTVSNIAHYHHDPNRKSRRASFTQHAKSLRGWFQPSNSNVNN
ncbi:hypothetical protein EV182_005160, partial [Spiromyces aspiralis]